MRYKFRTDNHQIHLHLANPAVCIQPSAVVRTCPSDSMMTARDAPKKYVYFQMKLRCRIFYSYEYAIQTCFCLPSRRERWRNEMSPDLERWKVTPSTRGK